MRVWVDADACPGPIKEIIFRAANRLKIETTLVANHYLRAPKSAHIRVVQVEQGFDIADNFIAKNLNAGDLVITQDIPLAAEIIAAGGAALNPRGTLYSENNIKDHLARRDMKDELRATGIHTGGPPTLDKTHIQTFANALDAFLTRAIRTHT